jgi:hypothetical protein
VTTAAGLSYLIYSNYIRPLYSPVPRAYYPAHAAYIQNARMCDKGYELPECENRVYCRNEDPTFAEKYPETGITAVCGNKLYTEAPFLLEESRWQMKHDLNEYMKYRDIFEKVYDAVLDNLIYPEKPK